MRSGLPIVGCGEPGQAARRRFADLSELLLQAGDLARFSAGGDPLGQPLRTWSAIAAIRRTWTEGRMYPP